MSQQAIRGALQTRLATLGWANQTAWEGVAFTPVAGQPYQEVTTGFGEPDAITLAHSDVLKGVFQVRLLYPPGQGTAAPDIRAKAVADAFPRNLSLGGVAKIIRSAHVTSGGKQGDRDVTVIRIRFSDR